MDNKVFIVAEAGVNHNGNIDIALRMVDAARGAGCDVWKGQCFWGLPKFRHLELTRDEFVKIKEHCDNVDIEFMSTPDTIEAVDFLAEIGMKHWKIGSRNATNYSLMARIIEGFDIPESLDMGFRLPQILLSTGACSRHEVDIAHNLMKGLWERVHVYGELDEYLTLLQCVSEYPIEPSGINLRVMKTYKKAFGCRIGLSDHTLDIHIPIAAVAMGASVIEKHFTLDKTQEGPDHHMSLEPHELAEMVRCIRDVELAIGDGIKRPTEYELKVRDRLRNYKDCK